MRGVTVDLPAKAKERLDNLGVERDLALDAARSAQVRLNNLPDDADPRLRERLQLTVSQQQARNNTLHRLLSSVNQYIFQLRLPPGATLVSVPTTGIRPKAGETAAEAIEKLRAQIAVITQQVATARRAPLKKQNQREALTRRLASMALRARPKISFDAGGNVQIAWAEDLATMDSVLGLLALCFPQELAATFEFDDAPDPPNALSVAERDAAVAKLSDDLLRQEYIESALLDQADGILPRPDMNPLAYLQLKISSEAASANAA
jgi:hypothetical protein